MKTRSKWLAALLTMVMILSLPVSVSAEGDGTEGSNGRTATNTYRVILELNGGYFEDPTTPLEIIVEEDDSINWPGSPRKDDFMFDTWYADEECQYEWDFEDNVTGDMILYAGWKKRCSATIDLNGGTIDFQETLTDDYFSEGDEERLPTVDHFDGWIQTGWVIPPANATYIGAEIKDKDGTKFYAPGETYKFKDSDAYLTVMWSPCTINIESDPSEGGTTTGSGTYENGKSVILEAKANKGYAFVGWYEGQNCVWQEEKYTIDALKKNRNLTAKFVKMWTVTFDLNGGTLDGKTGTVTIPAEDGSTITLPAPTKNGYTFDYWEGSRYNAGDKYTVKADHTLTAHWKKDNTNSNTSGNTPSNADSASSKQATAPNTGDGNNAVLWVWLLTLSMGVLLLIKNKMRESK